MAWPPPWLAGPETAGTERSSEWPASHGAEPPPRWAILELSDERTGAPGSAGVPGEGRALDRLPAGAAGTNRLLRSEEQRILDLIEDWAPIDRSPRKLAHRGSYTGSVFISPSTVQRLALKHGIVLPGEPPRPARRKLVFPEVPWEPNRIWMWEASRFAAAERVAHALVDVVSRYWLGYVLADDGSSAHAQVLYASALEREGLLDAELDGDRPVLLAWSSGGEELPTAGVPTASAHVESFFGHLERDWPHLASVTDPDALDWELARVGDEYNNVRLHPSVGYVTPSDEHHGRGQQIRTAREAGLSRARAERIRHNRRHTR
jgi:transposase InsO family protein